MRHILQCGGHPRGSVIIEVMGILMEAIWKAYKKASHPL